MRIISPSTEIMTPEDTFRWALPLLELAGRTCYKSEGKICEGSDKEFVKKILTMEHESVLEHFAVTVRFIVDRGVSHELVRHRLASFSQESTRYCNYSNDKFGQEITVIQPVFWPDDSQNYYLWKLTCEAAERGYFMLLEQGAKPQEARSVLPNSLKTEVVMTANLREWRHIFRLRTSPKAHPQMREVMIPLLAQFKQRVPLIFDAIVV